MLIKIISCEKDKNGYAVKVKYNHPDCLEIYPDGKGGQLGDRVEPQESRKGEWGSLFKKATWYCESGRKKCLETARGRK